MEQLRQLLASATQPLQAQLQEQAGRIQHAEAVSASLNTQMAQLSAQQRAVPVDEGERWDHKRLGLDDRDFRQCPKFGGDVSEWDNWKHSFFMCFYKIPELHAALDDVVKQAGVNADFTDIQVESTIRDKYRNALYRFLVLTTEGDALTVVRSVMARGAAFQCGFGSLAILAQRYDPKTPGRILQQWAAVLDPGRVKDVRTLQQHVDNWESKRAKLMSGYNEALSDTLSIAIFAKMLPRDLQDLVFQSGKVGESLVYRDVRDRIMAVASNRAFELTTPVSMDVGCVDDERRDEGDDEDAEIDAIAGKCYNCEGWGHAARECPSKPNQNTKGKGKNSSGSDLSRTGGGKGGGSKGGG